MGNSTLAIFVFLQSKELGEKIRVWVDNKVEEVSLVRRGRKRIRVRGKNGEDFLVLLDDVEIN